MMGSMEIKIGFSAGPTMGEAKQRNEGGGRLRCDWWKLGSALFEWIEIGWRQCFVFGVVGVGVEARR